MTEGRLPVAVIGAGHLGSRHARIYTALPEVELAGVADLDAGRAEAVAADFGVAAVGDYRELLPHIKAASVTVPTSSHHDVTLELFDAGVDVLVEKPIAASVEEARRMIAASQARGRILAVGHTERYNPAVETAMRLCRHPRFIEVHRLASFSPRSLDIDVILDLMIHDLDVVSALVDSRVGSIEAVGLPVLTNKVDIANARLRFDNGTVANITASRISRERVRKLRIWERDRYVSLDYLQQEAISYRLVHREGDMPEIQRETLDFQRQEPLKRELQDFVSAVREGRAPRVSGEDGLRALELATRILGRLES